MIAAVVLAAGKSERMGRPKALLPFRGRTFLETILDSISHSPVEYTVVVLGHYREEIERRVALPASIYNPNYEQGMITSLQAGIRALPKNTTGVLLFLIDNPIVSPGVIEALIEKSPAKHIVTPTFEGRRGHPVYFAAAIFEEILALPPSQGANTVLRSDPSRVLEVPVDVAGILVDIDTPAEFQQFLEEAE